MPAVSWNQTPYANPARTSGAYGSYSYGGNFGSPMLTHNTPTTPSYNTPTTPSYNPYPQGDPQYPAGPYVYPGATYTQPTYKQPTIIGGATYMQMENAARTGEYWNKVLKQDEKKRQPYYDAMHTALSQLQDLAYNKSDLADRPGYQWRYDQGLLAAQRSLAARRGLLSGGALKELTDYGQGQATAERQNAFQELQALAYSNVPIEYTPGVHQASSGLMDLAGFQEKYKDLFGNVNGSTSEGSTSHPRPRPRPKKTTPTINIDTFPGSPGSNTPGQLIPKNAPRIKLGNQQNEIVRIFG